jgi:outer membrane protein OmpA-like peptidoglycan-associated protein
MYLQRTVVSEQPRGKPLMTLRHSLLGLVLTALLFIAGCAMRESPALSDLHQARDGIAEAKRTGSLPPEKIADLEKQHLQARGVYYACREDEAARMAQAILAELRGRPQPVAAAPPPPPANQAPRARIKAPAEGEANVALAFSGEGSSDPDGDRLSYKWDFGDGATASFTTPTATHPYTRAGNYTVRLTVDDGRGGTDSTTATVSVIRRVMLQETKDRVLFDFDKATLKPAATQELADVVQELQGNPSLQAELVGHADATGSDAYNMGLSKRRAEAVRNFLVSRGIAANRIKVAWKGESEPIAPNTTKEGQAQNRRVEITIRPMAMQ